MSQLVAPAKQVASLRFAGMGGRIDCIARRHTLSVPLTTDRQELRRPLVSTPGKSRLSNHGCKWLVSPRRDQRGRLVLEHHLSHGFGGGGGGAGGSLLVSSSFFQAL